MLFNGFRVGMVKGGLGSQHQPKKKKRKKRKIITRTKTKFDQIKDN